MQDELESATQEAQQVHPKAGISATRDEMRQTAADVQDELASAAENVKGQVGDIGNAVEQRARAIADDKKAAGAEQLSGLARAINHAADELQDELPQAAGYVREAAAKSRQRFDHDPRAKHRRPNSRGKWFRSFECGRLFRAFARRRLRAGALSEKRCAQRFAPYIGRPSSTGAAPSRKRGRKRPARAVRSSRQQPVLIEEA